MDHNDTTVHMYVKCIYILFILTSVAEQHKKALFPIYSLRVCIHVYLQAVNVQQVEFSFVCFLQDVAPLNCHEMLLQVTFHFIKASETQLIQKCETV